MKREKTNRALAITALIVGIIALTVGFATFSGTLQIENYYDESSNNATFAVTLSSNPNKVVVDNISPTTTGGAVGGEATIDNTSDLVIKNLHAAFTEAGQTVTYKFYARNTGEYKAYLNNIIFQNFSKDANNKYCYVVKEGKVAPSDQTIKNVCDSISISVKAGDDEATISSIYSIDNHVIETGTYEEIVVTIAYNGKVNSSSQFGVEFGDIVLNYNSID